MEFRLLGPVEVRHAGRAVSVGGRQRRTLLALLLTRANEAVSADFLIDELWGEIPPPAARKSLQAHVSHLRRVLNADGELLWAQPPGYVLAVDSEHLDLLRFEELVRRGRSLVRDHPEEALENLEEALALWRGEALADVADETPSLRSEALRLSEARIAALESRIEAQLALGHHTGVVGELERLTERHPLRETLWAGLMLALYRSGRQAEALAAYQRSRRLLAEELGIEPSPELQDLEEKILLQSAELEWRPPSPAVVVGAEPTPMGQQGSPPNLPAPVSNFIGREAEIEEVSRLVESTRLVTITGAGGSGKTRLALEVARRSASALEDGVWFVGLAGMSDADLVAREMASTLGLSESRDRTWSDLLREHLAERQLLLVVDNCEHLLDAAAGLIASLLEAAPRLKVLATSREPLGITGEVSYQIPLMAVPPPRDASELDEISHFEAVQLFLDRARSARSDLTFTDEDADAIAQISRRLDGLPLALELAAARVRALTPAEIAAHLDDRFAVLAPAVRGALPRHQTLDAAVAWSYDLLTSPEQRLFRRLSVFTGGFDLGAAAEVAGDDVVSRLTSLVEKSLLVAEPRSGQTRYRMLETMAAFGQRLLGDEEATARNAHLAWVTKLARRAAASLEGEQQAEWISRVEEEIDNVRSAIRWALESGDVASGMVIASSLINYWYMRGVREGSTWIERLLAVQADVSDEVRAWALLTGGALILQQGEHESGRAAPLLEAALDLFRSIEDPHGIAYSLHHLSRVHWGQVDPAQLRGELEAALEGFRQVEDHVGVGTALLFIIWYQLGYGTAEKAIEVASELLPLAESIASPNMRAHAKELTATARWQAGDYSAAGPLLHEALGLYRSVGNTQCSAHCLESVTAWLLGTGRAESAAVLLAATTALRSEIGVRAPRWERPIPERARSGIETALGPEAFDTAWQRGGSLGFDDSLALALELTSPSDNAD